MVNYYSSNRELMYQLTSPTPSVTTSTCLKTLPYVPCGAKLSLVRELAMWKAILFAWKLERKLFLSPVMRMRLGMGIPGIVGSVRKEPVV